IWRSQQHDGSNSAAKRRFTDEALLNRWNLDFYLSKALDAFRKDEYTEFCEIRNILQSKFRPSRLAHGDLTIKLFLLQFLSRINDGDKLDVAFESEGSETPLESALAVLESICAEVDVPQNNLERVHTAIKEMVKFRRTALNSISSFIYICVCVCVSHLLAPLPSLCGPAHTKPSRLGSGPVTVEARSPLFVKYITPHVFIHSFDAFSENLPM
uniref:Telomere repeat-binding factor dimerisation domain-containing protein n=1 Tax=Denticeps clupeoides TaxID=299321 RepID=A0AAY4EW69_9TELE